jgi:hypothetical protein
LRETCVSVLRRAPGRAGQVLLDGPFPERLVLEFD